MRKGILLIFVAAFMLTACNQKKENTSEDVRVIADSTIDMNSNERQESVYVDDMLFKNQFGKEVSWNSLAGKVQVMAMIFTHCKYACPRITQDIKEIEKKLPSSAQGKVEYTLITFDVEKDSIPRLLAYYKDQELDTNWQLLHGSVEDVQTVGALLDVKFKKMEDGLFSHENIIFVLDQKGNVVFRQEGLGKDPGSTVEKVKSLL